MTTVTIKGALHLVDWGPVRYKTFHLPMDHADMLWGMAAVDPGFLEGGGGV